MGHALEIKARPKGVLGHRNVRKIIKDAVEILTGLKLVVEPIGAPERSSMCWFELMLQWIWSADYSLNHTLIMTKIDKFLLWDTHDPSQVPGLIIGWVLILDTEISHWEFSSIPLEQLTQTHAFPLVFICVRTWQTRMEPEWINHWWPSSSSKSLTTAESSQATA